MSAQPLLYEPAPWGSRTWSAPLADSSYREELLSRIQRFTAISETGCWEWQKFRSPDGYGVMSVKRRMTAVHQVSMAVTLGHIWPLDLQVDHLCRNRACCNPNHLEVVTPLENYLRGERGAGGARFQRSKTHCPRNHIYDEANTYVHPVTGYRLCRPCRAYRERRRKASA